MSELFDLLVMSMLSAMAGIGVGYIVGHTMGHDAAREAELVELARLRELVEKQQAAIVLLYDDVTNNLPDDVLALVSNCRAALEQSEEQP